MTDDTVNPTLVPLAAEMVEPPFGSNRACLGEDTERFFPAREPYETTWATKAICKGSDERPPCPVLDACLLYALHNRVEGIWGGTDDDERNVLRKKLGIWAEPVRMRPPSERRERTDGRLATCPECRADVQSRNMARHRRRHEPEMAS